MIKKIAVTSVALKGFQCMTVSDGLLEKTVAAIKAGDEEAESRRQGRFLGLCDGW